MIVGYRVRRIRAKSKNGELRWYRGTPVVLMLDEACFVFGDAMDKGTFQELANDLMQLYDEREYASRGEES